jgi:predicted nucleic acid-binding protein
MEIHILRERIYLDTSYLVDLAINRRDRKMALKFLERIKSKYREIFIPQTVIGESYLVVLKKSLEDEQNKNLQTLSSWIQRLAADLDNWTPPLKKDVLEMALDIKIHDYKLDYCDAVLAAHALLDLDASILFTKDGAIHESTVIQEKIEERCSSGKMFYLMSEIE